MKRTTKKGAWILGLLSMLAFSVPPASVGEIESFKQRGSQQEWKFPIEKTRGFYWDQLTDMGYAITAVNYDEPEYVEYEVVKGNRTYEVQIRMDKNTNRSTSIDVVPNHWKAAATKRSLMLSTWTDSADVDSSDLVFVRSDKFSDRDREQMARTLQELEELPLGQQKRFYRRVLQQQGFEIVDTDIFADGMVQFAAVKDRQGLVLGVVFDEDRGESIWVGAAPVWSKKVSTRAERGGKEKYMKEGRRAFRERYDRMTGDDEAREGARRAGRQFSDRERLCLERIKKEQGSREKDRSDAREIDNRQFSDRERVRVERMIEELESLPVGQDRQFYRRALRERGYSILAVSLNIENQMQLEAVKDGRRAVVTVNFSDEETNESVAVYASPLDSQGRIAQPSSATQQLAEAEGQAEEHGDETERQVKTEHEQEEYQ